MYYLICLCIKDINYILIKMKKINLGEIFISFMKIGVTTFGGGYAMVPILKAEVVDDKKWIDEDELLDYYGVGQLTPGLNSINVSIFIGNKLRGFIGGVLAAFAMALPSLLIILLIAILFESMMSIELIRIIFEYVRIGVCALILDAALRMTKRGLVDIYTVVIFVLTLALMFTNISVVLIILLAGFLGLVIQLIRQGVKK